MTYNFDPDRWYEDRRALLDLRRDRGEIGEDEYAAAAEELERDYDALVERLDGTYQLPR